ncbi:snaclec coagulation factor IX/factor X-binding protein subunit B3-like [Mobula hypostoma]|uniref:snaclec coagulation factor IX/factor X-binding protein subunit B3-like n=1 Tax=Mobula hypostoma TaxID=723540 RepID=UPI002FC3B277
MRLVSVLVVTALLVSDVTGTDNSTEVEETLRAFGEITRGPCEIGWYEYRPTKSCYRCFNSTKTWKEAEIFCNREKHYGQLASVTSCDHNEFISKLVRKATTGSRPAWIGLKDVCKNGNFLWGDESSVRYLNWAEGRPVDPKHGQHCTFIHKSSSDWVDCNCNARLFYVCAYKYH